MRFMPDDWAARYAASHRHPVNQVCHLIGIPLITAGLPIAAFGAWRTGLAVVVIGWAFQLAGHAVERKPPEFLHDWRFMLVGLRWWLAKVRGRV